MAIDSDMEGVLIAAAIMQVETDLGRIVVRPMHRQHIFETALVATEAFLVDRNPPEFQWML